GPSIVQYWGQNSAGATGSGSQKSLGEYCDDGFTDTFVMAFVNQFNVGSLPNMNLADACKDTFFPGTQLLHCPQVARDIKACQSKGKKILMSLGGASGSYGFQSDDQAVTFAHTLWNLFGGGKSDTRPFDDAVLDGFDLDIEGGGSAGYVTLVKTLRTLYASDSSKQYYVTAAPQCPFPDAILGSVIDGAEFDAVYVQFYNNYCSPSGNFNFEAWQNWATQTSPNKNVKVLLGIPGSPTAAGSGYQTIDQLVPILQKISQYSSFGGVSVWDASQSYSNTQASPNFAAALAKHVQAAAASAVTAASVSKEDDIADLDCPVVSASSSANNETCTGHATTCIDDQFAICNGGEWVTFSCPLGTGCLHNSDASSDSGYCGYVTDIMQQEKDNNNKKNTTSSCGLKQQVKPTSLQKPKVAANLYVASAEQQKNEFSLGINARRMDTRPFGSSVTVQMTVQPNTTITSVQGGSVVSQDGRQVTLKVRNQQKKSMTLQLQVSGKTEADVLVAPDARTLQF
ncbi:glycoside hydrolase superfamily, partial [Zychaea mexicana]|uniref:glycoside hydrolase superfamily n=1 Tax=Zychaea mexicana TaxID=64656 RepID=UPI0022FE4BD7